MKLLGYTNSLTYRPGDHVEVRASADGIARYDIDLVRLICGDTSPNGPGYSDEPVASVARVSVDGRHQPIRAGSHILINDNEPFDPRAGLTLHVLVWPTIPETDEQAVMGRWDNRDGSGFLLSIDTDGAVFRVGDGTGATTVARTGCPLIGREWYALAAGFDPATGEVWVAQSLLASYGATQGDALASQLGDVRPRLADHVPFMIAAAYGGDGNAGGVRPVCCFNGKVETPAILGRTTRASERVALSHPSTIVATEPDVLAAWDFSRHISSLHVRDISRHEHHGQCVNLPTRAMKGHNWDSTVHDWRLAPEQYGAIHFHDDDLADAGWLVDATVDLPRDLDTGVYCVRLTGKGHEDMLPIFVMPALGSTPKAIAFLASTATYQTYANMHHATDDAGAEMRSASVTILNAASVYLYEHRELGLSPYDTHFDGSGVTVASPRRPMPDLRPKAGVWSFNADTHLTAFLEERGFAYDVITDHALHAEGLALLEPYRVIVTGAHPEYWSTDMWRAMTDYLNAGGRLMYMGGNGFYWRIAFHPEFPDALEIRRAQAGARYWLSEAGEFHHAFTGELAGLWHQVGIAPQKLVGIGTVATGFDSCSYYVRRPDSFDPRAAWIFEGVDADERIGDFGQLGGASGLELDAADRVLGTPRHCLTLAQSEGHSTQYVQTVDTMTFNHTAVAAPVNPHVRADMVFFETPQGGAVWSTGSIAWCASLSHDNYNNNVADITGNVLRRFAEEAPINGGQGT